MQKEEREERGAIYYRGSASEKPLLHLVLTLNK